MNRTARLVLLAVAAVFLIGAATTFAAPREAIVSYSYRQPIVPPISGETPPVYLANGTRLINLHEVVGQAAGPSPVTVTLSGMARFSSSSTYFCVATGADDTQTLGPQIVNVDGAHFKIVHASADPAAVTYRCLGM